MWRGHHQSAVALLRVAFAHDGPFVSSWGLSSVHAASCVSSFTNQASAATATTEVSAVLAEIKLAVKNHKYEHALHAFTSAESSFLNPKSGRLSPNAAAEIYDCALRACAAAPSPDVNLALRLVSTMWKRGIPVGRVAQASILKTLCKAGHRERALAHLKSIPSSRMTTVHANIVLGACASAHDTDVGLRCWEIVQRRKITPDAVTWCEVLRLFGNAGNREAVEDVWRRASSISGDGSTAAESELSETQKSMVFASYVAALAGCEDTEGAIAACAELMSFMGHLLPVPLDSVIQNEQDGPWTGSPPNRATATPLHHLLAACNAALKAFDLQGQWQAMRRLVALMTARGLPPDPITYNLLLKAAAHRGEGASVVEEGIAEMTALGLKPTPATYAILMHAHAQEGSPDGAESAFQSMREQGLIPDVSAYNALFKAHAAVGDLSGIQRTYDIFRQGHWKVQPEIYASCFLAVKNAIRRSSVHFGNVESPPVHGGSTMGETASAFLVRLEDDWLERNKSFGHPEVLAAAIEAFGAVGNIEAVAGMMGLSWNPMRNRSIDDQIESKLLRALEPSPQKTFPMGNKQRSFKPSKSRWLKKDSRPLNSSLAVFAHAHRWDMIIECLEKVHNTESPGPYRLDPDEHTFVTLIEACAAPPRPSLARRLLEASFMRRPKGAKPSVRVYTALLKVECARGGVEAGMSVISEMYNMGAIPDCFTWTAFRACALQHHDVGAQERADRELRALKGITAEENDTEGPEVSEKHWQGYYHSYDEEDDW